MTIIEEQARALMLSLLEAGREPLWALLLVSWYMVNPGRMAALGLLEERNTVPEGFPAI
jgi:hypothetical protein